MRKAKELLDNFWRNADPVPPITLSGVCRKGQQLQVYQDHLLWIYLLVKLTHVDVTPLIRHSFYICHIEVLFVDNEKHPCIHPSNTLDAFREKLRPIYQPHYRLAVANLAFAILVKICDILSQLFC